MVYSHCYMVHGAVGSLTPYCYIQNRTGSAEGGGGIGRGPGGAGPYDILRSRARFNTRLLLLLRLPLLPLLVVVAAGAYLALLAHAMVVVTLIAVSPFADILLVATVDALENYYS